MITEWTNRRIRRSMACSQFILRTKTNYYVPGPMATSRNRDEIRRSSVRTCGRVCCAHAMAWPDVLWAIREFMQKRLQRVVSRFHGTFGILIDLNNFTTHYRHTYIYIYIHNTRIYMVYNLLMYEFCITIL